MLVYGQLLEARNLGYRAVRIWLCEGAEGILMDDEEISGLHPVLIESVAIIQEAAALSGLRLYWTLLDAHSCARTGERVTRAILTEPNQTARFADLVAAPLSGHLDRHLTLAVEVVNEPESLLPPDHGEPEQLAQWLRCSAAIKTIGDAIRSEQSGTLISSGSDLESLSKLWSSGPGLDLIDVHVKGDSPLRSRQELISQLAISEAQARSIPLIGGCFKGSSSHNHADYDAIFRWRL
jgi:hypothetical protein